LTRGYGELVRRDPLVDDVLELHRDALGHDLPGYRGHVYRTLNFALALAGGSAAPALFAVAAAFHDLGIWADGTFDYLRPSARRAVHYARERGLAVREAELEAMVLFHHRLRRCRAADHAAIEAFRRADWVDASWGLFRFGLPAGLVREVQAEFPNAGFHRCLLRVGLGWAWRHPTRPLPMLRW
jgi:hypothetical protein